MPGGLWHLCALHPIDISGVGSGSSGSLWFLLELLQLMVLLATVALDLSGELLSQSVSAFWGVLPLMSVSLWGSLFCISLHLELLLTFFGCLTHVLILFVSSKLALSQIFFFFQISLAVTV